MSGFVTVGLTGTVIPRKGKPTVELHTDRQQRPYAVFFMKTFRTVRTGPRSFRTESDTHRIVIQNAMLIENMKDQLNPGSVVQLTGQLSYQRRLDPATKKRVQTRMASIIVTENYGEMRVVTRARTGFSPAEEATP